MYLPLAGRAEFFARSVDPTPSSPSPEHYQCVRSVMARATTPTDENRSDPSRTGPPHSDTGRVPGARLSRQDRASLLPGPGLRCLHPGASIQDLLTLDLERCSDPCLTPLIPVGQAIVPMSSLIVPGSPLRNFTALLQLDPGRFGAAGRALGQLGIATVCETLRRVPEAHVATNVDLVTVTGVRVGDLDVVLVDPANRCLVIFEVSWQIGPDGGFEVGKAERKAVEKRAQVSRNRAHLAAGTARAEWPPGWPDITGFRTRWYVLTRDVLPLAPVEDEIVLRSHQMVDQMLPTGASLEDLVGLLDDPPVPPEELTELREARIKFGQYLIHYNGVAL